MTEDLLINIRPTISEAADAESVPESEREDIIGLYITKIRNKDSGFLASDLDEYSYQDLTRFLDFIEGQGFFIPERGKILNSTITIQNNLLTTLLKLFLNIFPLYYTDDPDNQDIRDFYNEVKTTDAAMHEFIKLQTLDSIKDFLKVN
jgi:hypothetical protein